jgi:hypothetical protein
MATMAVNNKTVQLSLVIDQQLESGNNKLIQKRSKYVQCDLKLYQHNCWKFENEISLDVLSQTLLNVQFSNSFKYFNVVSTFVTIYLLIVN